MTEEPSEGLVVHRFQIREADTRLQRYPVVPFARRVDGFHAAETDRLVGVVARARTDGDPVEVRATRGELPLGILAMTLGCLAVYSALFATGYWIYGQTVTALVLTGVAVASTAALTRLWRPLARSA